MGEHFMVYEDRREAIVGVKLLALSLFEHVPDASLTVYSPGFSDFLQQWLEKHRPRANAVVHTPLRRGWDVKPEIIAPALQEHETAFWLSRDPMGERGGINLYGYVGNDPINAIDPLGLWTASFGAAVSGSAGIQGAASSQFTISANSWNPIDWRIGSTASVTPLSGTSTNISSGLGVLVSFAPHVDEPEAFNGWSATVGASGGEGAGAGYDLSNISRDPCSHKINTAALNHNVFIGRSVAPRPTHPVGHLRLNFEQEFSPLYPALP